MTAVTAPAHSIADAPSALGLTAHTLRYYEREPSDGGCSSATPEGNA
jgi:hypothetical protein